MSAGNGRKPRGSPANSATIAYWKVLHQAGEPLTHEQVAEQWTDRTGFMSDAMRAYSEYIREVQPAWLDGKRDEAWSKAAKDEAWHWWVRQIGLGLRHTKTISVSQRRGTGGSRSTYVTADPPVVQRIRYEAVSRLVPYDPDEVEDEDAGHVAGMRYTQAVDDVITHIEKLSERSVMSKELRQQIISLLRDGKHAIRRRTE